MTAHPTPPAPTPEDVEAACCPNCEAQYQKLLEVREAEIERLRHVARTLRREREGSVWVWQGDDEDHLESLTCPVLIHPEQLEAFRAQAREEGRREGEADTRRLDALEILGFAWRRLSPSAANVREAIDAALMAEDAALTHQQGPNGGGEDGAR